MKNIITAFLFFLAATGLFAQQEAQNTQFMQYKLGYNPAFAGSTEAPCITALYRKQWIGLDGAPEMQVLSFNMPLNNQRVGVGGNIVRTNLGITETYTVDAVYAYRVRLGQGMLGMGLQGSIRSMEAAFQKTTTTQNKSEDPSALDAPENKFLFNFGAGAYYNTDKFYFGLSIPRLLKNNVDFGNDQQVISREVHHFYLMAGIIFDLSESVQFQPQVLAKYVVDAPFDADVNANFIFSDKYIAGLTYRLGGNKTRNIGESLDVLLAMQLSNNLMFGVSYDITLSDLKDYNSGSIEVSLHYCMGKSDEGEYVNPRFF
ncbi:MAG: type IX secretion system membrane protein PorP/SprF [Bacteroidetes bacterium]|nr:MAG: type IX secretion system membrane protein PorP/SprF [Bacteroidota bacterium]